MRHSYSRLWDGRIIDSTEGDFYEYKDGKWVEVEGPLSMHMLWFAEHLESMEEVEERAKLPYDPNVHFHGEPCCLFEQYVDGMAIYTLNDKLEMIADFGEEYKGWRLTPGDEGDRRLYRCRKGLLLCGLFSPEKIDSIDFPACVFAAPEFKDMLANKPLFVSAKARRMGVTEEMTGMEIAEVFEAKELKAD